MLGGAHNDTLREAPVDGDYDGRQYVGIDLHRRRSVIVRMTPDGEQLGWVRIDNDPVALGLELAKAGPDPEVVLEATYGWYWAVDVLQAAGATVHLAHPLGVKGFAYRRVKNDVRDAADLADLVRMGRLPEAYIATPHERELRELVRHRAKLVALRSGRCDRLGGLLHEYQLVARGAQSSRHPQGVTAPQGSVRHPSICAPSATDPAHRPRWITSWFPVLRPRNLSPGVLMLTTVGR
jgi:hypothetical protein